MALNTFGGSPSDVLTNSAGDVIARYTGGANAGQPIRLTVWTSQDRSTQVTTLYAMDGVTALPGYVTPVTSLSSANYGRVMFRASDAYAALWLWDGNPASDPWLVWARETPGRVSGAVTQAAEAADDAAAASAAAVNAAQVAGAADSRSRAAMDTADAARLLADRATKGVPAVATIATSGGFTYQTVRVKSGGAPVVSKAFANDYETAGTTGSSFRPSPRETLASFYARTGADIVINASGWDEVTNVNEIRGAQVKDGVAYHDFGAPGNGWGEYAIGFRGDGSAKTYSVNWGDSVASMVEDGVVNSFSFGPCLVRDGVKQTLTGTQVSARQAVGVHANGDLIIVTVLGKTDVAGATYPQLADLAFAAGMREAVALDGGGSAQALVNGGWTIPSSDTAPRPVADALLVNARVAAPEETPWVDLTMLNGFTASAAVPGVKIKAGVVWYRGAATNATATTATKMADVPWWAKPGVYKRLSFTTSTSAGVFFDVDTDGQLLSTATATFAGPRYLDVIRYPVGG